MIRPESEIEYPPSEALCLKARMLARMEALADSSDGLAAVIAERMNAASSDHKEEMQSLELEQKRLLCSMRDLVKGE